MKAQAPIKGGGPPTSVWCLRQIVARQSVILTRDPRSKHQGSSCVNLSYIFLIKKMRISFYVNLTNGGKNGINIRLQNSEYGRMDRGPGEKLERVLLSYDDNWNERNFGRDNRRNLFTFQNKGEIRNFFFCRKNRSKIILDHVAKLQGPQDKCGVRKATRLDQPNGKIHCPGSPVRGYGRRGHNQIVYTSGPGREIAPGFLIIIINNCDKAQASSLTKAQALGGTRPQARCVVMSH